MAVLVIACPCALGLQEADIVVKAGYTPDVIVVKAGQPVIIELTPDKPGEYDFACQMGMLRGKLIVE